MVPGLMCGLGAGLVDDGCHYGFESKMGYPTPLYNV